ncbi:MAG: SCO family protein, partial [Woeseiaceae bacterium]|nr:SCO family protein [Woeseiaceae bacterium]
LDHDGNAIDASVFEGQWDLVFFGFTHCPDICPITLQVLADARRQLAANGQATLPRIVLVSVDPERDTPEILGNYIAAFGDGNLGITGDLQELRKLTGALGIFFQKAASDNDYYSVDHASVVIAIDPQGRYRAVFSSPHKASNFVHDFPLLTRL